MEAYIKLTLKAFSLFDEWQGAIVKNQQVLATKKRQEFVEVKKEAERLGKELSKPADNQKSMF
jgi:hypothetical protein